VGGREKGDSARELAKERERERVKNLKDLKLAGVRWLH
jgi:hypothetical protein